jgi:hypothetical protein
MVTRGKELLGIASGSWQMDLESADHIICRLLAGPLQRAFRFAAKAKVMANA